MNVLGSIGAFVLFATLSFPLSAGAFGRAPSSSEVHPTGTVHLSTQSRTSGTTTDSDGTPGTPHAVPESSSFLFLTVALGLAVAVSVKKRFGQTFEK